MYLESGVGVGSVNFSVPSGADKPTLFSVDLGATVAVRFYGPFMAGATSDFRFVRQYSTVTPAVGNLAGKRFNLISPVLGMDLGPVAIRTDYQFLGDYSLAYKTAEGDTIRYRRPIGGRLALLFPHANLSGNMNPGIFYEYLVFREQKSDTLGSTSLSPRLTVWQAGVSFSWIFSGGGGTK